VNRLDGDPGASVVASRRASGTSLRMLEARAFIEAHFTHPITPTRIARHVGLATPLLNREFQRAFGESPRQVLMNCRMRAAHDRLADGTPTTEVALQVGYHSDRTFAADYRKWLSAAQ
jgi:AraC-like DNA-binding protein